MKKFLMGAFVLVALLFGTTINASTWVNEFNVSRNVKSATQSVITIEELGASINDSNLEIQARPTQHLDLVVTKDGDYVDHDVTIARSNGQRISTIDIESLLKEDGLYQISFNRQPSQGGGRVVINLDVDTTIPEIRLNNTINSLTNNPSVALDLSASDANGVSFIWAHIYRDDRITQSFTIDARHLNVFDKNLVLNTSVDGFYEVVITSRDTRGNVSNELRLEFTVDVTLPTVVLNNKVESIITEDNISLDLTASDLSGVDFIWVHVFRGGDNTHQGRTIDAQRLNEFNTIFDLANLENGFYEVVITTRDLATNVSNELRVEFTVELPEVEVVEPIIWVNNHPQHGSLDLVVTKEGQEITDHNVSLILGQSNNHWAQFLGVNSGNLEPGTYTVSFNAQHGANNGAEVFRHAVEITVE